MSNSLQRDSLQEFSLKRESRNKNAGEYMERELNKSRNMERFTNSNTKKDYKQHKSTENVFRISKVKPMKKHLTLAQQYKQQRKNRVISRSINYNKNIKKIKEEVPIRKIY